MFIQLTHLKNDFEIFIIHIYNNALKKAGWQSGYAAACKAVYAGSIPASASRFQFK